MTVNLAKQKENEITDTSGRENSDDDPDYELVVHDRTKRQKVIESDSEDSDEEDFTIDNSIQDEANNQIAAPTTSSTPTAVQVGLPNALVVKTEILETETDNDDPANVNNLAEDNTNQNLLWAARNPAPSNPIPAIEGQQQRQQHRLTAVGPARTTRRRCSGCYKRLRSSETRESAAKKVKRVTTKCFACNTFLCLDCFSDGHPFISK
ncbi:hypothetical protein C0J52_01359 [Blattella germanica]|nr:hypothetical protein C0J52_01359 [Blattella germanica]